MMNSKYGSRIFDDSDLNFVTSTYRHDHSSLRQNSVTKVEKMDLKDDHKVKRHIKKLENLELKMSHE